MKGLEVSITSIRLKPVYRMSGAFRLASKSHVSTMPYIDTVAAFLTKHASELFAVLASLFSGFVFYKLQQQRRKLTYQRIASIPLLTVKEELAGRLSVNFDGQPVKSIRTTTVRIKNAGNLPITAEDQKECIAIGVGDDAKILSADIVERTPSTLNPILDVVESFAFVRPLLLNSGDSFVVKLLIQDGGDFIYARGRIVGVSDFERVSDPDQQLRFKTAIAALVMIFGSSIQLLFGAEKKTIERTTFDYIGMTIMFIGFGFFISYHAADFYRKYKNSKSS